MSDLSKIIMLSPILLVAIVYCVKTIIDRNAVRIYVYLVAVLGSFSLWVLSLIVFYATKSAGLNVVLYNLDVPLCSLTVMCIHLLALRYYKVNPYITPAYIMSLAAFPFVSLVLAFTSGHNEFIRSGIELLTINGELQIRYSLDIWFWIMLAYNVLLLTVSLTYIIANHLRLLNIYRPPSLMLMLGIGALIVSNIVVPSSKSRPLDTYMIVAIFAVFFIYSSIRRSLDLDFLSKARDDIYTHFAHAVFILDGDQNIIEKNEVGFRWFSQLKLPAKTSVYSSFIEGLIETATQIENLSDAESGKDFYFDDETGMKAYNLREKPIFDNKNRQIGTFVVLEDVTENRALIQRLEVGAGRDSLTGLNNRGMMEIFKTELSHEDYMPLAVLVCDLNNLKKVNDTIGHQQGDLMLRVAGEALNTQLPPNALAGRIGGDEFLVLIPKTTYQNVSEIMQTIREHLSKAKDLPFEVTMAMGAAVMESSTESIETVFKQADEAMYANKRTYKTRSTEHLHT